MCAEISIKVSGDDRTFTQKYLCYNEIKLSMDDEELKRMVQETMADFKGTIEDVVVRVKLVWL